MPSPPFELLDRSNSLGWEIVLVKKSVLGQQSGIFWLDNWLGINKSHFDVGYIDRFAAGLPKQQPHCQWYFFMREFIGCMTYFSPHIHTFSTNDFIPC
jgi:hypothetical protein